MRSWGLSLAVHGVVLGLGATLWSQAPSEPEPDRFRWEVAFAPAPQPPPAEPSPPEPPAPRPAVRKPAPTPPQHPATPQAAPPPPSPAPATEVAESALPAVLAAAPAASAAPAAPQPAPPVAAPRAESAADAAAEAQRHWYAALLVKLREMKRYPLPARRLGQEGVVLLAVHVAADGRLVSVSVKQGSGHPILDREAVRLMEEAAEAARGSLRPEQSARLEIPIAYRLETERL